MLDTDFLKFSSLKVFDCVKDNLPDDAREIAEVYEDLLFVWNFKNNNIKVVNWRATQTSSNTKKEIKHQLLIPSSIPNFSVSKIAVSFGGSYVSISGKHGLSILELPHRFGTEGIYQDGKQQITCKTSNIHEHSMSQLEVIQAKWHPNSPTDSHLLVLLSDNTLRVYDEGVLKHIWRIGPLPNQTDNNLSYLKSLGYTAIDFDIGTPQVSSTESQNNTTLDQSYQDSSVFSIPKRNVDQKKVEWVIIILRGNGTIYIMNAGLNTEKPRLQGPITMTPSQKDNYGDDSCSLLVIPTNPMTIVIAENSGILHHALLIENPNTEMSLNETKTVLQNDWTLYVMENIELELGLQNDDKSDTTSCPIYLKRDLVNEQRYFCYHDTGLHGITIGFVQKLQNYLEDQDNEQDLSLNVPSRAEYILSTKAFNNSKVNAIVGFGILQLPSGIFAVMSSGQVVSLNTVKTMLPLVTDLNIQAPRLQDMKIVDDQLNKVPFDQHIRALLKSDVSQPILQLDKTKPPSSQQTFQLLMNTLQIMREKQFARHDKVRQEISKRIKILELMKHQQKDEIGELLKSKEQIQEKAYKLADMHEDIMEKQQNLQKRIQDISRLASLKVPAVNEKEFIDTIKNYKGIIDKLASDVKQIKAKDEVQKNALDNYTKTNEESIKTSLPPKQEETIKEFLNDMMRQIQGLKSDVHKIHSVVDY
ncbi:unnamed protein product [Chironomus riparius]|uniref:Nuclear pore complex protein Nup88 n=1 Tax=Chironomus riparius TaxID=315576 RepID=A0A9N9S083_9DIPT|nr:unnamed protein product [Chironomus riparius]